VVEPVFIEIVREVSRFETALIAAPDPATVRERLAGAGVAPENIRIFINGGNMQLLSIIYRLAVTFWVGGVAIFTFVLTPIIFKVNDRDVAGRIVGTLFPGYFRWGLACGAVALVTLLIMRGRNFVAPLAILLVMLSLTAFQGFFIEPRAAALKKEIPSFVTTPKDHPLRKEFSRLHGISAACNLTVFAGGVVLVILL